MNRHRGSISLSKTGADLLGRDQYLAGAGCDLICLVDQSGGEKPRHCTDGKDHQNGHNGHKPQPVRRRVGVYPPGFTGRPGTFASSATRTVLPAPGHSLRFDLRGIEFTFVETREIDMRLQRYTAAEHRIGANLQELEQHSVYQLLTTDVLTGATPARSRSSTRRSKLVGPVHAVDFATRHRSKTARNRVASQQRESGRAGRPPPRRFGADRERRYSS